MKKSTNKLFHRLNTFGGQVKNWPLKYKIFFGLQSLDHKKKKIILSYQNLDKSLKFLPCFSNPALEEKIINKFKKFSKLNQVKKRNWKAEIKFLIEEILPAKTRYLTLTLGLIFIVLSVYFNLNFFFNDLAVHDYLASFSSTQLSLMDNLNNETLLYSKVSDVELVEMVNGEFIEF